MHALAELDARAGRASESQAIVHYRDAFALATEIGMRPLVAQCHLGLGQVHRAAGEEGLAHEHLKHAVTMLRDMEMTYWLERAERALGA